MRMFRKCLYFITGIALLLLFIWWYEVPNNGPLTESDLFLTLKTKVCKVKLVLTLCDDTSNTSKFERQINQTLTLIKSVLIALDAGSCVHIILVSNKKTHFDKIASEIFGNLRKWDTKFTTRLNLEFVPLKYPEGMEWMRGFYKNHPCSSFRLFLPDIIPYDSVILSDTDIIYLRNIEDLWSELGNFNSSALVGMVLSLRPQPAMVGVPCYGKAGISAGVMLMNLTRMRKSQWTRKVLAIANSYLPQLRIGLAEQGMMNIYFNFFPEEMHQLSCDWNFRYSQCNPARACTEEGIHGGISALHGMTNAFAKEGIEPLFHAVYDVFLNTQLTAEFYLPDLIRHLDVGVKYSENW